MLSRVADTLWWMSRFVERAEGVTRIVQVHRDSDLETEFSQGAAEYWNSALIALYAQNEFELGKFKDPGSFIIFSPQWIGSVINCVNAARENARMVRDQLSEEIWVELNNLYHFLNSEDAHSNFATEESKFYARIIRFSLIFQGLSDATIHQDEGWRFMTLGKYLERADLTSRVLDTLTLLGSEPTRLDLIRALRSCSAFSAFKKNTEVHLRFQMWQIYFFLKIFHVLFVFHFVVLIPNFMKSPQFPQEASRMKQKGFPVGHLPI